ncbi:ATP-dependent DNA helicase sgs1 [Puccinia graminis f. sp. tritici]|uniref:DNA 3'-5' helicase n=1 Tax=Puccinia graminis f. sp. tritici TaxID=56615 RepID=A0A5B0NVH7_PUCGR|nr:ATP-dependent DNA helicase sgs1 [Puccinia graminis f. sp. tritici]KAA1093616.1 ATP-dependent DNA helicase sgs1 [Puccinia graminis f. sp. tritici]
MLRRLAAPAILNPQGSNVRIQLLVKIAQKNDIGLKAAIAASALARYGQSAKTLQIEAVFHLARGINTFLLAGTGFGKSRIPEIYHTLLPKSSNGVILVLNPLDALGDNQVLEKIAAGFTAINLTKLSFNEDEANNIVNGVYNFVYLSPEIFLNSPLWDQVYFCSNFQNRLSLVVVDEAHIIYQWGLIESNGAKNKATLIGKLEDIGIFRPSYGQLGGRLLTRNNKPILLMSATCRPLAIREIQKSLKFEDHNFKIVKGELTRPEIRIIRVPMSGSMNSCSDLVSLFPSQSEVADSSVVPSLIYSGTRKRTLQVMKSLDSARGSPGRSMRPNSPFVRRFHACTGEKDKLKTVEDFSNDKFPVISCTMALGMGQNWSRVRMVIPMGRADPSAICQMIGRAGRDGCPGVGIFLVQKIRKGGKNSVEEFDPQVTQGHDDRMDALAVTPVCLRIAFAIDNSLGYIPLSVTDPSYITEMAREKEEGFNECHCSNCKPDQADGFMRNIQQMTAENMDEFVRKDDWPQVPIVETKKRKNTSVSIKNKKVKLSPWLQGLLSEQLTSDFGLLFDQTYSKRMLFSAADLFGKTQVDAIIKRFGTFDGTVSLRKAIGGQMIPGQLEVLEKSISIFTTGAFADEANAVLEKARQSKAEDDTRKRLIAEERAERNEQKKEQARLEKARKDEARRVEEEKRLARKAKDDEWNSVQMAHLALLVRLAGAEAERKGLASIHRGRYESTEG